MQQINTTHTPLAEQQQRQQIRREAEHALHRARELARQLEEQEAAGLWTLASTCKSPTPVGDCAS